MLSLSRRVGNRLVTTFMKLMAHRGIALKSNKMMGVIKTRSQTILWGWRGRR